MFQYLNQIDVIIVFGYLLACVVIGYSKSNKIKTLTEYAVGSRTTTTFALMTAVFATRIGAGATIGEIERVFSLGIIFAVSLLLMPTAWFFSSTIFAKNIEKFKDCISLTDIMRKLYGKPGQWFTVFASLIDSLGSISAQLSAIGFLFQYILDIPNEWGVVFAGTLVCMYVFFGGAKSVILTDIFQFLVFYAAMPIACVLAVKTAGGLEGIVAKLPSELLEFDLSGNRKWLFFSFCFYAILPPISATFIQRYLMAKNSYELGQSLKSIALITFPFTVILCVIGFTVKSISPDLEPNNAFYHLIIHHLPTGVVGITIAAVFAIIMSSANSWLNSGATIVANDVARHFNPNMTEKQGLVCARIATIVISAASIGIAIIGGNIIKILWFTDSYWFPVMLVPIIAGMFGLKTSSRSFVISASGAIIIVSIIALISGEYNTTSICLGIFSSLFLFFANHYFIYKHNASPISIIKSLGYQLYKLTRKIIKLEVFKSQLDLCPTATNANFTVFCIFIVYQYIPSMFDTAFSSRADTASLIYLKISVLFFAFPLVIDHKARFLKKQTLSMFWKFNIFYSLCYIPFFMLIVNANKTIWVINLLLCLSMIIALLPTKESLKLGILGFIFACITSPMIAVKPMQFDTLSLLSSALPIAYGLMGIILIYIAKKTIDRREEILSSNASFVAHEAINPLSIANMSAQTLDIIINKVNSERQKTDSIKISSKDWEMISNISAQLSASSTAGVRRVNSVLSSSNNSYTDIGCYQVSDIIVELLEEFKDHKSRISTDLVNNFIFYGSKEGIKTALSNLLRNSIKYAGKKALVSVKVLPNCTIIVSDNGIGIPEIKLNAIFDKNFTSGGHGFGLTLCKQIIEDHGGQISCTSIPKKLTEFKIEL